MNRGIMIICTVAVVCLSGGCWSDTEISNGQAESIYYEAMDSIDGYELYVFGNEKYCIQLPQKSVMIDNSANGINNVYCRLNSDNNENLSIGFSDNTTETHYTSVDEVKKGFKDSGTEINGDIVSFETTDKNGEYSGYKFLVKISDDAYVYYRMCFEKDTSIGFNSSVSGADSESLAVIDNCIDSLYVLE